MRETGALLAGELSGHIFVGGDLYYGFDDALFDAPAARENAAIGSGDGEAHTRHLVRGAEGSFKRRR